MKVKVSGEKRGCQFETCKKEVNEHHHHTLMMVYRRIDTQELWGANNPHHQLLGVNSTVHHVENTKKTAQGYYLKLQVVW